MTAELVLLIAAASWRIWRLIARDDVTDWARSKISGWPLALVECAWCLGTWIALAVTFAVDHVQPMPTPWLIAGAAAALVGLTEEITQRFREP